MKNDAFLGLLFFDGYGTIEELHHRRLFLLEHEITMMEVSCN